MYVMLLLSVVGFTSACGKKRPASNVAGNSDNKVQPPPSVKVQVIMDNLGKAVGQGVELFESDLVIKIADSKYRGLDSFVKSENKDKVDNALKAYVEHLEMLVKDYGKATYVEMGEGKVLWKKLNPEIVKEIEKMAKDLATPHTSKQGDKDSKKEDIESGLISLFQAPGTLVDAEAPKEGEGDGDGGKGKGKGRRKGIASLHAGADSPEVLEKKNPEPRPPNPPGTN